VAAFLSSLFLETPLQLLFPSLYMYNPCWTNLADTWKRPSPERLQPSSWEKPRRAATVTYLFQRLLISQRCQQQSLLLMDDTLNRSSSARWSGLTAFFTW